MNPALLNAEILVALPGDGHAPIKSLALLAFGRTFGTRGLFALFTFTALFTGFGFLGLFSGGFGAAAALFGPVLFAPGFGRGGGFGSGRRWSRALDADFDFSHHIGMEAQFDIVLAQRA